MESFQFTKDVVECPHMRGLLSRQRQAQDARRSNFLVSAIMHAETVHTLETCKGGANDGGLDAVIHHQRVNATQVCKGGVCDGGLVALPHVERGMPRRCAKAASVNCVQPLIFSS